ncbi:RLA class II histocompatibility antigen, DP alpha-1 chain, partial [Galemys pyrenaicus]
AYFPTCPLNSPPPQCSAPHLTVSRVCTDTQAFWGVHEGDHLTLPEFIHFFDYAPWRGMANIIMARKNLKKMIERANHTRATSGTYACLSFCSPTLGNLGDLAEGSRLSRSCIPSEPPEVTMLPKEPWSWANPTSSSTTRTSASPALNVTWLRTGQRGTVGVAESIFLPGTEFTFHRFHYLTFLPTPEDVYGCRVEHQGLDEPLLKHWGTDSLYQAQEPIQLPEMMEAVVCAGPG